MAFAFINVKTEFAGSNFLFNLCLEKIIKFTLGLIFTYYYLILTGFKILKIKEVPKHKVVVYVSIMFLLGLFLNPAISVVFRNVSYKPVLYFTSVSVSFLIVFLLLKYYFLLSGKRLWQFLLYLIVVRAALFLVINFVVSAI